MKSTTSQSRLVSIAPFLSHNNGIGSEIVGITPRSVMNFFNHTTSLAASLAAIYSASVVESAVVGCLELFQDTAPPFKVNRNPDVDLLSSGSD